MEAAIHARNLESSILFMQQEHAATLKALHQEIHRLQKRCTDLTFQLTMHGISVEDQGDVDSRLQQVHHQLQQSRSKESVMESQLSQTAHKLQELERELRAQKKRHLDEMRSATHNISGLKAEVEAKSSNIAFLTTELHRLKVRHKQGEGQSVAMDGGPTIVRHTQPQYSHLPAPPRDMMTKSGRVRQRGTHALSSAGVRHMRATPSSSSTSISNVEAEALARSLRVASASGRSSGSDSPDISPFVQRDVDVVEGKKPAPLPPILPSQPGLGERDVRLDKRDLQPVVVGKSGRARVARRRPSTPEVTSLAVDQVSDVNWNRPPQSHSSEFN